MSSIFLLLFYETDHSTASGNNFTMCIILLNWISVFLLPIVSNQFLFEKSHKETSSVSDPGQGTRMICLNKFCIWPIILVQLILQFHPSIPHHQKGGDNKSFLLAWTLAWEEDKTSANNTISLGKHHNMACKDLNKMAERSCCSCLTQYREMASV